MNLKHFIFIIIPAMFSCGQQSSETQSNDSKVETEAITLENVSIVENDNRNSLQTVAPLNSIAKKAFYLTTDYDIESCKALGMGDCFIAMELFFIDDKEFAVSHSCGGEQSYFKGIYLLDSSKITLKYDSLSVYSIIPFGDEYDSVEYGIKKVFQKFESETVLIKTCGTSVLLQLTPNSSVPFQGTEVKTPVPWFLSSLMMDPNSEIVRKLGLK